MTVPDFVAVGHVVQDLVPDGWRLGGTVTYAAVQATRLGLEAGIVTRSAGDLQLDRLLPNVHIAGRPASCTTAFENRYALGRRSQTVPRQAEPISAEDVPPGWSNAHIVLLGSVCGELPPAFAASFSSSLIGVSAQGWLRSLGQPRRVRRKVWSGPPFWAGCRVLLVSDEDLGRHPEQLERWIADIPLVVLTRHKRGARLHVDGSWRSISAFPAREVDPTGGGDVFAAAFLIRYDETADAADSARFASAAAACSVEAQGLAAIPTRAEIERRMEQHPEVALA